MTDASPLSLAVIGHVNHGKTALVRTLTGIETDRLPEEQARGLSITLGFAWRDYPAGGVDFLDAPGHEDFIRAMVMGATGARAALLVVSATEGFGRQTREHLRIAGLLGLRSGIVAVTKADLLAEDAWPVVLERILGELDGTFLAGEPVVFCSSVTGAGLDALHDELQALASRSSPPDPLPGAYLPLDRVFSVAGAGTVATGTLQGRTLTAGGEAILQPSGRKVHLRLLQAHGQATEVAHPGGRVAVGLRGVPAHEVRLGEVLCTPGAYEAALLVDVELTLASDAARPLRSTDEVRVMWGARQDIARLRLIGATAITPGGRGLAQLRFHAPVIAYAGQRAILRRPSPAETIGGATVLDPAAPTLRAKTMEARGALLDAVAGGGLDEIAAELASRGGGSVSVAEAARLSRRSAQEVRNHLGRTCEMLDDDVMALEAAVAEARQAYLDQIAEAHRRQPARAWVSLGGVRNTLSRMMSRELIAHVEKRLSAAGEIRLEHGQAALRDHDPFAALSPAALARLQEIEAAFRAAAMTPPDASALDAEDQALLGLLVECGRLVSLRNVALRQTLAFHVEALDEALEALRTAFPPPAEFTTGEARAALGTSRKFIVPALEFFDDRGETVRRGDLRQVADAQNRFGVPRNPP
ncbi:selenocysteine-specific translation elongation factor [Phenylobacterium sp.]|uniref:selenocysteine-specific translation elongation factor n=1 Tax=Phenylobacterium sp. TaxID=1871053 RepID=UPI003982F819